jgi:hypothetical protein
MLRPDNLEALLAVCMVQTGFEVFAYCRKFHFLARGNPGLESLNLRSWKLFPAAMRRPLAVGVLTRGASSRCGVPLGARRWWSQTQSHGRHPNAACRAGTKVDHWLMER